MIIGYINLHETFSDFLASHVWLPEGMYGIIHL